MVYDFLLKIVEVSLSISLVILLILVLRPLLIKKYMANCSLFIWLILAVMLLLPVKIIPNINPITINNTSTNEIISQEIIHIPIKSSNQIITTETQKTNTITIKNLIGLTWVVVGITIFLIRAISSFYFYKQTKRWSTRINETEKDVFYKTKNELHIKSHIELRQTKYIKTPMMVGLFKPIIYLPKADVDSKNYELILLHELSHFKRKDIWIKLLLLLVLSVHWFNPLVHIMNKFVEIDIEKACDNMVLKTIDKHRKKDYGIAILESMTLQKKSCVSLVAGFVNKEREMNGRFLNIVNYDKKSTGLWMAIITIILCIACKESIAITYTDVNIQEKPTIIKEKLETNLAELKEEPLEENDKYTLNLLESYINVDTRIDTYGLYGGGKLIVSINKNYEHKMYEIDNNGKKTLLCDGSINPKYIKKITMCDHLSSIDGAVLFTEIQLEIQHGQTDEIPKLKLKLRDEEIYQNDYDIAWIERW